jgi:hypothetical protein
VAATKRGFEPEIWKIGFDKIAAGDFGRCSAAATVRSEAEDERRSREQSLPLRQTASKVSSFSITQSWQRQRGDNARKAAPKGRGAQRRVVPPPPPLRNSRKNKILRANGGNEK